MSYRNLSDFWKCLTELSGNLCILWSHCCYYSLLRSAFLADFCHDGGNFASLNRRTRAICLNWSMIIFSRHRIDTWLAPYADTLSFRPTFVAHAYSIDRYVSPDISCQPQVYPVVRGFEMMCTVKLRPYRSNLISAYYSHCLGLWTIVPPRFWLITATAWAWTIVPPWSWLITATAWAWTIVSPLFRCFRQLVF